MLTSVFFVFFGNKKFCSYIFVKTFKNRSFPQKLRNCGFLVQIFVNQHPDATKEYVYGCKKEKQNAKNNTQNKYNDHSSIILKNPKHFGGQTRQDKYNTLGIKNRTN